MSKYFMKSSWGSDDATRAAMVLGHSNALARAGHEVRIFLLGEATVLVRAVVRAALQPMGWPSLAAQWDECRARGIEIIICDACRIARGVTPEDIAAAGARIGGPDDLVAGFEWADKVIAE